ncbi:hypothetical protein [Persicobacter diffluens]|uniref:HTH luxR-type domain-containing protein n=1 Tax=Persicobacter diffluens TaxID=981 RepID=A0AAN4W0M4_9BACT|nr:hypothetical protein PEDI_32710 [Persicobacter diffluens]
MTVSIIKRDWNKISRQETVRFNIKKRALDMFNDHVIVSSFNISPQDLHLYKENGQLLPLLKAEMGSILQENTIDKIEHEIRLWNMRQNPIFFRIDQKYSTQKDFLLLRLHLNSDEDIVSGKVFKIPTENTYAEELKIEKEEAPALPSLNKEELFIIQSFGNNQSCGQIADRLNLSIPTIKKRRQTILEKFETSHFAKVIVSCFQHNLIH